MWESIAGVALWIVEIAFFGSLVVVPLIRAPRTANPRFTRAMGILVLGTEIIVVSGIMEAGIPAFAVGGVAVLVGLFMAASS